jgi:F-type H+-transporting ATPase subunit b
MVLFIVLVLAYQLLVQGPLSATLKERRARTEGAAWKTRTRPLPWPRPRQPSTPSSFARRAARSSRRARAREAVERRARRGPGRRPQGGRAQSGQAKAELEAEAAKPRLTIQASAGELAEQRGSRRSAAGRRGFPLRDFDRCTSRFSTRKFPAFLFLAVLGCRFSLVAAPSATCSTGSPRLRSRTARQPARLHHRAASNPAPRSARSSGRSPKSRSTNDVYLALPQ